MSKIINLKRKTQRARERETLKAFSRLFPECERVFFEREKGLDAVICLDCGRCLFVDLDMGLISVGQMYGEGCNESA